MRESERSESSRIFPRVRVIQSDQSEYVPRRALLKDQFSWLSNGVTLWLKDDNIQDDKTLNVNAEEFRPTRSVAAAAEQKIRDIVDNEDQWRIFDLYHQIGENNMEISRSY